MFLAVGKVGPVETWNQWSVIPIADLDEGNIYRNPVYSRASKNSQETPLSNGKDHGVVQIVPFTLMTDLCCCCCCCCFCCCCCCCCCCWFYCFIITYVILCIPTLCDGCAASSTNMIHGRHEAVYASWHRHTRHCHRECSHRCLQFRGSLDRQMRMWEAYGRYGSNGSNGRMA